MNAELEAILAAMERNGRRAQIPGTPEHDLQPRLLIAYMTLMARIAGERGRFHRATPTLTT